MARTDLVPASLAGRIAAYLVAAFTGILAGAWLGRPDVALVVAVVLGASILVGATTPLGARFANLSGVVVAACLLAVAFVAAAATDGRLFGDQPWIACLGLALVPIGLDWRWVSRLRARTVASAVVVLLVIGADRTWAVPGAVSWFVGAVTTLWLLQADVDRNALRPTASSRPATPTRGTALVRTVVVGLALGALVAVLVGDPTLTPPRTTGTSAASGRSGVGATVPAPTPAGGGGASVVREPDGSTRRYDRDPQGNARVQVTDGNGTRTYVYTTSGDGGPSDHQVVVHEYDENGSEIAQYTFDDHATGAADASGTTGADDLAATPSARGRAPSRWLWILAAVVLAGVVAGGLVVTRRDRRGRRSPSDWAHRIAAHLDREGRRRGRPRRPAETVREHTRALAEGPWPDGRVRTVGEIVSAALFGRHPTDPATRAWVEQMLDEGRAAHPRRRPGRAGGRSA